MTSRSDAGPAVTLTYTNHRGETADRTLTPTGRMVFAANHWHPKPQWLVEAHDARSDSVRLFALAGFGGRRRGLAAEILFAIGLGVTIAFGVCAFGYLWSLLRIGLPG